MIFKKTHQILDRMNKKMKQSKKLMLKLKRQISNNKQYKIEDGNGFCSK